MAPHLTVNKTRTPLSAPQAHFCLLSALQGSLTFSGTSSTTAQIPGLQALLPYLLLEHGELVPTSGASGVSHFSQ